MVTGVHNAGVTLSARDADVVRLVGWLGQASSAHLRVQLFTGLSDTTFDRSASRLLAARYLHRVGRRSTGVSIGASPIVYQLGVKGWAFCNMPGAYQRSTAVNEHSLGVADVFVALSEAHRAGHIELDSEKQFLLEYEVGAVRADVWAEFAIPSRGGSVAYYLEIDLGSERPIRIEEKCAGYWQAYTTSPDDYWPYVVFVVPDERRKREVERVLRSLPSEQQELFRVFLFAELVDGLLNP